MTIKGKILIGFLGILPLFGYSQNLIPNPSFESHSTCVDPPPNSSLQNCDDWFNAVETSTTIDWYSTCYPSGSFYLLPNIYFGFSYPHLGDAMIGFVPYSNITNIGEAAGVRLTEPLKADSAYCLGFWIKNSRNHNNIYSMHEFDIAFIDDTTGIHHKSDIPQYITVSNYSDDGNWNYLSTYYIASGNEEYLLIGSFNPVPNYSMNDPNTTPENKLYYYLDDFNLTNCNKDSLLNIKLDLPNVFTPNDDGDNDFMTIKLHNIKNLTVTVLNRWGEQITQYDGTTIQWDGKDKNGEKVSDGVYFIHVTAETNFGEILNKQQFVQIFRDHN